MFPSINRNYASNVRSPQERVFASNIFVEKHDPSFICMDNTLSQDRKRQHNASPFDHARAGCFEEEAAQSDARGRRRLARDGESRGRAIRMVGPGEHETARAAARERERETSEMVATRIVPEGEATVETARWSEMVRRRERRW
ncbi:hypothetical protein Scep_012267 [Stephania cephalantha]|uniref:Uncharacterized protein n=1 Tax=Stephania cephalantha TaxID=152367 RepID=A0AAP0JEV5_9MAGN